jgi:crotonobetainyl-CoA:carnitine CoA-transferase CaiB-like acyl-CoA transferase
MRYETVIFSYGWGLPSRSRLARSPVAAPVFQQPASDGFVDMLIMQEDPWRALLSVLGDPSWSNDELFATHPSRSEYWDALEPLLREELRKHSASYLFTEGQRRGIAIAPINTIGQAAAADQFVGREFFRPQDFGAGEILTPGMPFLLSEPVSLAPAPALGEHNRHVFAEVLGCSDAELAAFGVAE